MFVVSDIYCAQLVLQWASVVLYSYLLIVIGILVLSSCLSVLLYVWWSDKNCCRIVI